MCDPRVERELHEIREAFAAIEARLDALLGDRLKPTGPKVRKRPDGWMEASSRRDPGDEGDPS